MWLGSVIAVAASSSQNPHASKNPSHTHPAQPRPQQLVGNTGGARSGMPAWAAATCWAAMSACTASSIERLVNGYGLTATA